MSYHHHLSTGTIEPQLGMEPPHRVCGSCGLSVQGPASLAADVYVRQHPRCLSPPEVKLTVTKLPICHYGALVGWKLCNCHLRVCSAQTDEDTVHLG